MSHKRHREEADVFSDGQKRHRTSPSVDEPKEGSRAHGSAARQPLAPSGLGPLSARLNAGALPPVPPYRGPPPGDPRSPNTLPPLPPILDPTLEAATFTHQSAVPTERIGTQYSSYERLEFLGDAYIECIASRIIFQRFPLHTPGMMSQLRELMVRNETLAEFARSYGFDGRVLTSRGTKDMSIPKLRVKMLGDVVEAYVAAIILSQPDKGFTIVEEWLEKLWEPIIVKEQRTGRSGTALNAKQDLNVKIMGKGVKLEYVEEREPQVQRHHKGKTMYTLGVYLTGWGWVKKHLGSGSGWNKTEAGDEAAKAALANHPLIDQIAEVKREYDARVKAEREQGKRTEAQE